MEGDDMEFLGIAPGEILALIVTVAVVMLIAYQLIDIGRRIERRRAQASQDPTPPRAPDTHLRP